MAIERKLIEEAKIEKLDIEVVSLPEDFVIKADNTRESLYERLNSKDKEHSYDAWCRHSD